MIVIPPEKTNWSPKLLDLRHDIQPTTVNVNDEMFASGGHLLRKISTMIGDHGRWIIFIIICFQVTETISLGMRVL